jgi:flagellar capping protein FliD
VAVSIEWTLNVGLDGPAGTDKTKSAFEASTTAQRYKASEREQRYQQLKKPLVRTLERKLLAFQKALAQFQWPDTGSMTMAPEQLAKRIETSLPPDGERERTVKHVSRGFEPTHPVNLDAGAHEFVLQQGGSTDVIAIDVEDDWTNADMLDAVSQAINDSDLPAHAEVVTQAAPEQRVEGLMATGQALVVTLNQAEQDQAVALRDTSGHLILGLDLKTLETPLFSAEQGVHYLQGSQAYRPTTYSTPAFDPEKTTSLSAGTHSIDYAIGQANGAVTFNVEEDDTWEEVLSNVADAVNSSQGYMVAETFDQQRSVILENGDASQYTADGVALRIEAYQPKRGNRLSLSGDVVDSLNMTMAYPGTDAHMTIDGEEKVRSPGVFAADEGRLLMALSDSFGETLPLRVVSSLDRLETAMADIVNAYNDLRKTLVRNTDLLEEGFADRWRAPLQAEAVELRSIGLQEFGKNDEVWLNRDKLHTALAERPDAARRLLLDGPNALVTTWEAATDGVLAQGVQHALIPATQASAEVLEEPSPRTENQLAKGHHLLDLYDSLPSEPSRGVPESSGGSLVDSEG